jgi:hypothetical protein
MAIDYLLLQELIAPFSIINAHLTHFIGILITAAFHHELHIFFSSKTISATLFNFIKLMVACVCDFGLQNH